MKISRYLVVGVVLLVLGCSSAPPPTDEVYDTRNRAAEYAEFGHRYFEAARYDKALEFYQLSLDNNIAVDNEPGIVKSQNSIGKVYMVTGRKTEAAALFAEALETARRLGDPGLIAMSSSHIGEYLLETGDTQAATDYFTEALDTAASLPDTDRAILLHNAGTAYRRLEQYGTALDLFNQALSINEEFGRLAESASNRYMIASVYAKQGNYDGALEYARKALEDDKKAENKVGIAKDHRALGLISEQLGETSQAYGHYEKAYTIFDILRMEEDRTRTLGDLVRLATLLGKDQDAKSYLELLNASDPSSEESDE